MMRHAAGRLDLQNAARVMALAARFAAPQRAMACALHGRAHEALRAALLRAGKRHEAFALEAMADPGAYAVWNAAPLGATALPDDAVMVALRTALGAPILAPTALLCKPLRGRERKPCPLTAGRVAGDAFAADRHSRVCKRGGGPIKVHDHVRARLATLVRSWGVAVEEECGDFLSQPRRIDMLVRAGAAGLGYLAIDFTRRDTTGEDGLAGAERGKEKKYGDDYSCAACVRGFGFNQYGQLGPQAKEVVWRLAAAGERACGADRDALRTELVQHFAHALVTAQADVYARAAELNGGGGLTAPRRAALRPEGQRLLLATRVHGAAGRNARV
jgi:hypothetical protein